MMGFQAEQIPHHPFVTWVISPCAILLSASPCTRHGPQTVELLKMQQIWNVKMFLLFFCCLINAPDHTLCVGGAAVVEFFLLNKHVSGQNRLFSLSFIFMLQCLWKQACLNHRGTSQGGNCVRIATSKWTSFTSQHLKSLKIIFIIGLKGAFGFFRDLIYAAVWNYSFGFVVTVQTSL